MKLLALLPVLAIVAGCGTASISVPVTGQIGDGTPAAGEATARTDGKGTFWVQVPGGLNCSGNYNSLVVKPTLVVPVSCTDGRTGEAVITRQMDYTSGTAIVTLSDGTKGQFVFGNITFDQAYGVGSAKTHTVETVRIVK